MRICMGLLLCLILFPWLSNGEILEQGDASTNFRSSTPIDLSRAEQISGSPRGFVCKGFLTDEDLDSKDKFVPKVEAMVTALTGLPAGNLSNHLVYVGRLSLNECNKGNSTHSRPQLGVQIENLLKYHALNLDENKTHVFIFVVSKKVKGGCVTMAHIYLSDVPKFPRSEKQNATQPKGDDRFGSAKQGYAAQLKKGDALVFFDVPLNATPRKHHNRCTDWASNCADLIANGGCDNNMIPLATICSLSCKTCKP